MSFLSQYKDPGAAADTRRFYKFKDNNTRNGHWSGHGNTNFYIGADKSGKNRCIYIAGNEGNGLMGLGSNRTDILWSFVPIGFPASGLEPGEMPEEIHEHGGANSIFVVTNYGNLYSMGENSYGVLGLGDTTRRHRFEKITAFNKNVAKFAVSSGAPGCAFCYVVTTSGQLFGWGYNGAFNLGFPSATTPVTSPSAVTTGSLSSIQVKDAIPITYQESYEGGYGYVIDVNNDVHVAGQNGYGQLGNGYTNITQQTGFARLSGFKAEKIVAGAYIGATGGATFALSGGKLWNAGFNEYGQLGTGDTTDRNRFTLNGLVSGLAIQDIEIGDYSGGTVMAILTSGEVVAWGRNREALLGDGTTDSRITSFYNLNNAPSSLGFSASGEKAIKIRIAGATSPTAYILTNYGKIYTTGDNQSGKRGVGNSTQPSSLGRIRQATLAPHPYNLKFLDITVWGRYTESGCTAVDEKGDLWSIGGNNGGQAGTRMGIMGAQDMSSGVLPTNWYPTVWSKCVVRESVPLGSKGPGV